MPIITKSDTISTSTGTVAMGTQGESVLVLTVNGTHAGFTIIVEGSLDGTLWFPANAINAKNNTPVYGSHALATNATRTYYVVTGLYNQIRVRASARSSGSLAVQMVQGAGVLLSDIMGLKYLNRNVGKQTAFVAAGTTGANSVLVSTGPGILHKFSVTTAGATAGIIVYDNATTNSGTILYASAATHALGTYDINMRFENGVTVRKASTTAAGCFTYTLL
jgi:hypothetical protein